MKVTAKEYLLQIKEQKQNIRKQEEYIQRLRDSLTIAGISYDKERIQSSPDPDKFAKIFGHEDQVCEYKGENYQSDSSACRRKASECFISYVC